MTGRLRIAVAAAVATALTATGLMRLLAASTWLWPVLGAIVITTASGELARRLIRPRPLVVVVQVVFVAWYSLVVLTHEAAWGGIAPGPGSIRMLGDLLSQARTDMRMTVPGGPSTAGITAILVLSLGALAILVDALAATYAVAPLAGLPLLALYLVPATRVGGGYDWLAFTLTAAGYTALLSSEGRERLGRWGRPLVHTSSRRSVGENGSESASEPQRPARVDTGPIAATGHQITMIALCAAILAPVLLPTVSSGLFGLGPSNGDGTGGGLGHRAGVKLSQALDLKTNLTAPNLNLFTYTATDAKGHYIRLSTLDRWDGISWSAVQPTSPLDPVGNLQPRLVGVDSKNLAKFQPVNMTITLQADLNTGTDIGGGKQLFTLPVPYPAKSVQLSGGGWLYNPQDFVVAGNADYSNKVTNYTVQAYEPGADPSVLDAVPPETAQLASQDGVTDTMGDAGLSSTVTNTADAVVGTEARPFEQALKLMDYFAASGQFHYNQTSPPDNVSASAAMDWLLANKQGFCQTFAETMAAMARHLGIPSRVALGFTAGKPSVGSNVFTVGTHDFHAWPELYFHGLGWLRFEPTVGIAGTSGGGNGQVPAYAVAARSSSPSSAVPSSSASKLPGSTASSNCSAVQRRAGGCSEQQSAGGVHVKQKFGSLGWFGAVPRFFDYWLLGGSAGAIILRFVLLAALLVASVPMVVRILRRRRRGRIASGRGEGRKRPDPEPTDELDWQAEGGARRRPSGGEAENERVRILAAWAEVRDSATDLGYKWPASETPRQSAERIVKQARFSDRAQDAMDRMTGLAERANYARTLRSTSSGGTAPTPAGLFEDVRVIRSSLAEPVSRRTRMRATVLPPSAMAALRERREDLTGRVYERVQLTGSRVTGRVRRRHGEKRD